MAKDVQEVFEPHLQRLLSARAHPKTICPSEVARSLSPTELKTTGVSDWRDLMPVIREHVWREFQKGHVEILQKGEVLDPRIELAEIKGPIRVRKMPQ